MKYVTLWAGKEACTYLSTVEEHQKNSLESLFETLDDWTKPKADEIAAFTQLWALNQGNKTLSDFILEVRRLVELCNLACNGDKEKFIRNCIIAGITSTNVYQQCISKGSSLTLSECIKICQTEDATCRQVQTLRQEIQSQLELQDCTAPVHKVKNFHHPWGRSNFRGRGSHRGNRYSTSTWGNHYNTSHNLVTVEIHNTNTDQNAKPSKLNVIFAID